MAEAITFVRTEEQAMLASTVRDLLESTTTMDAVREMSLVDDAFDEGAWRGLAEMGVIGLHLPEEYGGAGFGFADLAVVFEELGRRVVPSPLLSSFLASSAILAAGDEGQKSALLPAIASGEVIATLATSEGPHHGDQGRTTATRSGDGWIIEGVKRYVTDAPLATAFVVSATTEDGPALFVLDKDADGMSVEATHALDPTRPLGAVTMSGVSAPEERRLAQGDADAVIRDVLDAGVVALAQEQVGGAQRCLEMATDYARSRYQFGRAIGSFQAVKHMCADMLVAVEHAKSAAWHAARALSDPDERTIAVALAKSVCSDAYVRVAGDNIQVHGGIGFTWEHDAHLYLKRAKSTSLLLGSVDSYRDRLGDAIGV